MNPEPPPHPGYRRQPTSTVRATADWGAPLLSLLSFVLTRWTNCCNAKDQASVSSRHTLENPCSTRPHKPHCCLLTTNDRDERNHSSSRTRRRWLGVFPSPQKQPPSRPTCLDKKIYGYEQDPFPVRAMRRKHMHNAQIPVWNAPPQRRLSCQCET